MSRRFNDKANVKQVWVVSADPIMLARICCVLREMGLGVRAAGMSALREATWKCDLLLCAWEDWILSRQVLGAGPSLPRRPRVVFVSRTPNESQWVQALGAGAFDLIEEPHSPGAVKQFRRAVAVALGLSGEESEQQNERESHATSVHP